MDIETTKLTIRLPKQDVDFVKRYAREHGLSVTEVIDRYLRRIRALEQYAPAPELDFITGIIPTDLDTRQAYQEMLIEKHSQ